MIRNVVGGDSREGWKPKPNETRCHKGQQKGTDETEERIGLGEKIIRKARGRAPPDTFLEERVEEYGRRGGIKKRNGIEVNLFS